MKHFKIFGWLWVGYWTPYGGMFMTMHRSFWTHFPFISTAIRMAYLFWWLLLLKIEWQPWHYIFLLGMWLALSLSDMGHYISDLWFSNSGNSNQIISNSWKKESIFSREKEKTRRKNYAIKTTR